MFDPSKTQAEKVAKAQKRKILKDLVEWCTTIVPINLREGLMIDVKEVICGDPTCSPIDTLVTIVWAEGGRGLFSLPMAPEEVTQEEMIDNFPDDETLTKWHAGEICQWPPLPSLRFPLGARVECRIGPHPVKGWAPGKVIKHYYSEPSWPANMAAPYQIALHDGRLIFAPSDEDAVIRLRPPALEGAPPSPEYRIPVQYDEDDFDGPEGSDDDGVEMTQVEEDDFDEEAVEAALQLNDATKSDAETNP